MFRSRYTYLLLSQAPNLNSTAPCKGPTTSYPVLVIILRLPREPSKSVVTMGLPPVDLDLIPHIHTHLRSQKTSLTEADPRDSSPSVPGSARACRSWSSSHSDDPGAPRWCGCQSHLKQVRRRAVAEAVATGVLRIASPEADFSFLYCTKCIFVYTKNASPKT